MFALTLKATFQNITRRFSVPRSITFSDLESTLRTRFAITTPFVITYEDPEHDTIMVSSDEELAELVSIANSTTSPVRVHMFTHEDFTAGKTAQRPNDVPQGSVVEVPRLEQLIGGVAELLDVIKGKVTVDQGADIDVGTHEVDPPADVAMNDVPFVQPKQTEKGTKGLLGGLRPYMAAFPDGKGAFKKCLWSVSPQVKMEFKKLVRYVVKSEQRITIVAALKDGFPLFRCWIGTNVGETEPPNSTDVEKILGEVKNSLSESGVEGEAVNQVADFMGLALADEGTINILRKIKDMEYMPWEKGFVGSVKVRKVQRDFDVHQRIACNACKTKPIVGTRYCCVNRKKFNLCEKCYRNNNVRKEGLRFTEYKYIWESALGDAKVPPAPLKQKDRGPKVMFLHKVLTDLGYMNEAMYKQRPGLYANNTRHAVTQFQREKMDDSVRELGTYDESTSMSLGNAVNGGDVQMTSVVGAASQPLVMHD